MLCLFERLPAFGDLKSQISDLKSAAEKISRQLRAWADSLQNTPIRGQRYLTEKSRRVERGEKDRQAFMEELRKVQSGN